MLIGAEGGGTRRHLEGRKERGKEGGEGEECPGVGGNGICELLEQLEQRSGCPLSRPGFVWPGLVDESSTNADNTLNTITSVRS